MASEAMAVCRPKDQNDNNSDARDQVLADLRARIGAIEQAGRPGGQGDNTGRSTVPIALTPDLDRILPEGGLTRGGLHEVVGVPGSQGAAAGFAAALMGLAAADQGVVLWCRRHYDGQENGELYGPGLAAFGLGPERLLEVRAGRDHDVLWALEEGLQSTALCAVLGEVSDLSFTASRRLQLAAESRGVPALILRHNSQSQAVSAARTRWRVESERTCWEAGHTGQVGTDIRWKLNLLRCRGAMAESQLQDWQVAWRDGGLHDDGSDSETGTAIRPESRPATRYGTRGDIRSSFRTEGATARDFAMAAPARQRPGYTAEPGLAV